MAETANRGIESFMFYQLEFLDGVSRFSARYIALFDDDGGGVGMGDMTFHINLFSHLTAHQKQNNSVFKTRILYSRLRCIAGQTVLPEIVGLNLLAHGIHLVLAPFYHCQYNNGL